MKTQAWFVCVLLLYANATFAAEPGTDAAA